MTPQLVLLGIGAYLLGSVPSGALALRWARGIDIRKVGTGKIGASNVLRSGSKRLAAPVAIFDIGKGVLPVLIARWINLGVPEQVAIGLLAIVGHNWSIYLKFQGGGRGIFTSLGVIAAFSWKLGIIAMVMAFAWAPVKQVALGVLIALVALPFFSWFLADPLDITERLPVTVGFVALTTIAVVKRLIAHRSELSQGVPWGEILLNRLLFDRDIGDRRLWTLGAAKKGK